MSVIVLTYNHEEYLDTALESVVRQRTDFDIEVLVGEDRSSDGTLAIARQHERRRPDVVRVVTDEVNVGMLRNLARLIEASRGRYVAICEGDDFWTTPDKLARQVAYLEAHPGCMGVHGDFDHAVRTRRGWRVRRSVNRATGRRVPSGPVFDLLLAENFIMTCTLTVRREAAWRYLSSGLPVETYSVGDWPLALHAAALGDLDYLPETCATYRRVETSVMNQGYEADLRRARDHLRMVDDFSRAYDVSPGTRARARATVLDHLMVRSLRAGDLETAREALAEQERTGEQVATAWSVRLRRRAVRHRVLALAYRAFWHATDRRALARYRADPVDPRTWSDPGT